jgi:hypothetical protein
MSMVKNHMVEFDTEILRKDFTVDDTEREAISLRLLSLMTTLVLAPCNTLSTNYNKLVLRYKNFEFILLNI